MRHMHTDCGCVTGARAGTVITRHARTRAQQRAIQPAMLDMLLDYGASLPAGGGAEIVFLPRWTRQELAGQIGAASSDRLASAYAVVSGDGAVITVGHRYRRQLR